MCKKGFTLVELSIVLVIIGLLIGGILAAQSMIGTAKIQGVTRQISQYDVAISNFQTKYNSFPGDSSAFGCVNAGSNTCDNGQIDDYSEMGTTWSQLSFGVSLKNSQGNNYVPFDASSVNVTSANCPVFNIDQDKTLPSCLFISDYGNAYVYAEPDPGTGFDNNEFYPFKGSDMLALDQKLDDGNPNTGHLKGGEVGDNNCINGSQYDLTGAYLCILFLDQGLTNGTQTPNRFFQ